MADESVDFLTLFADRLEAHRRRQSSIVTSDEPPKREIAVQAVAAVFQEQLITPAKNGDAGTKIFHGLLALDQYFISTTPNEQEIAAVVEKSQHDYYAFRALGILARLDYSKFSERLRTWEKDVLAGFKTEPKMPRGPSPVRDIHRNMLIVSQLKRLAKAGIAPTRNEATQRADSGCDIVAGCLGSVGLALSYRAVEAVWKNRDKSSGMPLISDIFKDAVDGELTKMEPSEK